MLAEGSRSVNGKCVPFAHLRKQNVHRVNRKGEATNFCRQTGHRTLRKKRLWEYVGNELWPSMCTKSVLVPRYQASSCAYWSNQGRSARGSLEGPSIPPHSLADAGVSARYGYVGNRVYRTHQNAKYQHHGSLRGIHAYAAAGPDCAPDDSDSAYWIFWNAAERNAPDYRSRSAAEPGRGSTAVWAGIRETT